jgi:hypothetical protein
MADTTLNPPSSATRALTTSYLGAGSRYLSRGARSVTVSLDSVAMGYWVALTAAAGGSSQTLTAEHIGAGGSYWQDLTRGGDWYLDIKSDSGTPNAQIRVA